MSATGEALTELEVRLGLPRRVRIDPALWTAAMVLGRMRTLVNNQHRRADRDRGTTKNALNDRQGALGELLGLWLLHHAGVGEPTRGLLDLDGSVDLPDLTSRATTTLHPDVKCHLDDSQKKLFAVNQRACKRSHRRGVDGFLPLVSRDLAGRALLGRLIPLPVLQSWRVQTLGSHRDPAHVRNLDLFAREHLSTTVPPPAEGSSNGGWGPEVVPPELPARVEHALGLTTLVELRRQGWSLDGLSFDEVEARLLALVPDLWPPRSFTVPCPGDSSELSPTPRPRR